MRRKAAATWQVVAVVIAVLVVAAGGYYYYATVISPAPAVTPENRLVVYGSVDATDMQGALNSFKSKYPSVSVDYEQMTPPAGLTRITSEVAGNKTTADATIFTNSITVQLQTGNYLSSYNSSERSAYPSDSKDAKGYWTAVVLLPTVFAYNTQQLNKSTIPTTLAALTNPQLRGKVTMHDITVGSTGTQYMLSLVPILGNSTWTSFVQNLQANVHPVLNPSVGAISDNVASGQYAIGIIAFLHDVLKLKSQGAPIDWFLPAGIPLLTVPSSVGILKAAQHPNAAKLFVDFILSTTGQKAIGNVVVRIPARPNVGATYSLESVAQGLQVVYYPSSSVVAQARTWAAKFKALGFGT